jgi:hypothetical protein
VPRAEQRRRHALPPRCWRCDPRRTPKPAPRRARPAPAACPPARSAHPRARCRAAATPIASERDCGAWGGSSGRVVQPRGAAGVSSRTTAKCRAKGRPASMAAAWKATGRPPGPRPAWLHRTAPRPAASRRTAIPEKSGSATRWRAGLRCGCVRPAVHSAPPAQA